MGTRHLILIYHNATILLAQYGGHDGHPSHTGRYIMTLLSDPRYVQRLRANTPLIRRREANFDYSSSLDLSFADDKAGLQVLDQVAYAEKPLVHDFQLEFADIGGSCEWVYLVDLDSEVLEVYRRVSERVEKRLGREVVMRGRLKEVGVKWQLLVASFPFIDLAGDKEELVEACGVRSDVGEPW